MHQSAIISKKYMLHMLICIRWDVYVMSRTQRRPSEMTVGLANSGLLSMVFRRVLSNYRVIIERLSAVSPFFC